MYLQNKIMVYNNHIRKNKCDQRCDHGSDQSSDYRSDQKVRNGNGDDRFVMEDRQISGQISENQKRGNQL